MPARRPAKSPDADAAVRPVVRRGFLRRVMTLAGGTLAGQGLVVAASPILTRLYAPDAFGAFAVFVSLLTILSCVATLRYEMAIPLPEGDGDAFALCAASAGIACLCALCLAIPALLLPEAIANLAGAPALADYLWLAPLGVLGIGVYQSLYYWAVRTQHFGTLSTTRIAQSVVMLAIQIGAYAAGLGALVVGQVASRYTGISALTRALPPIKQWKGLARWRAARAQLHQHRNFALWSAPGALLNATGAQLPMLAFAALYSTHSAGLYALTHRVLSMPVSVVGTAVADVFFSDAPTAQRQGKLGSVVAAVMERLMLLGMPAMAAIMLTGPTLFSLLFGSQWTTAGELARLAAPWLLLTFITSPLSRTFLVVGRQRELFVLQLLQPCLGVLAIGLAIAAGMDFRAAFITLSLSYAAFYLIYLARCLAASGCPYGAALRAAAETAAIAIVVVGLPYLWLAAHIPAAGKWGEAGRVGLCGALTLLCYAGLFFRARRHARRDERASGGRSHGQP